MHRCSVHLDDHLAFKNAAYSSIARNKDQGVVDASYTMGVLDG